MKIDSSLGKLIAPQSSESKVARNDAKQQAATKPENRDEVQLTSSKQLLSMSRGIDNGTPIDSAKVDAIKQAIAEGRFKINPEMIADRLLSSVKDLLESQKA